MTKHIVYMVTYTPHIGVDGVPKYYIGSKYNWKGVGTYFGSVSSSAVMEYTDGLPLYKWWKTRDKGAFSFDILFEFVGDATPDELVLVERDIQISYGISSPDFFNSAYAAGGFCAKPRPDNFKSEQSIRVKKLWDDGVFSETRQKLVEFNKRTKSSLMVDNWNDPEYRLMMKVAMSKPRGDDWKRRCKEVASVRLTNIEYKGANYLGWQDLLDRTGVSKHLYKKYYLNGIDPEPNIGCHYSGNLVMEKM